MKKSILLIFSLLWIFALCYFSKEALVIELPQTENDYLFYFKENGKDLKYLITRCLQSAQSSIFISSFGITDKEIAHLLETKKVPITVAYDAKESNLLPKGDNVTLLPYTKRGLMHRKVVAIDKELILLGSTNLTPMALKIHHNLVACIRSKALYSAIENSELLQNEIFSYFPLPETAKPALATLLQTIASAKHRIYICMYTFTHPKIIEALLDAHSRGIDVRVYLDRGMAKGTCKKATEQMAHFAKTHLSCGLLHHKCALIDDIFIFGSANWTKAAFAKNDEYILFLHHPPLPILEKFFHYLDKISICLV